MADNDLVFSVSQHRIINSFKEMVVGILMKFCFYCYSLTGKQRCIVITVLVGLIIGILVFLYANDYFSKSSTQKEELVPPDPISPLPPSASKLRVFKKAAVCVDAAPCAEVGR